MKFQSVYTKLFSNQRDPVRCVRIITARPRDEAVNEIYVYLEINISGILPRVHTLKHNYVFPVIASVSYLIFFPYGFVILVIFESHELLTAGVAQRNSEQKTLSFKFI